MTKKIEPVCIEVPVGEEGQDFQTGNFLNAIDHLFCWFNEKRFSFDGVDASNALKLYAEKLDRDFVEV